MEMSLVAVDRDHAVPRPLIVAVAIKVGRDGRLGNGSRRAVSWAAEGLMPFAGRFVLVHVITSIPTPSEQSIPVKQVDAPHREKYMHDRKLEIFETFKQLCKRKKVEILVLEGDNPASALLKYVNDSGVSILVLGSCKPSLITRILPSFIVKKEKEPTVPSVVLNNVPEACNVFIVSKRSFFTTSAFPWSTSENSARNWWCGMGGHGSTHRRICGGHYSSLLDHEVADTASSVSDVSHLYAITVSQPLYPDDPDSHQERNHQSDVSHLSITIAQQMYPADPDPLQERNQQNLGNRIVPVEAINGCSCAANGCPYAAHGRCPCTATTNTKQSAAQAEVEKLRLELTNAVTMYNQACKDLLVIQNKIRFLSSQCLKEAQQINDASRREEIYREIYKEEQSKHLEAVKEIEMAREKLAKEVDERKKAESKALKESEEKEKILKALIRNDRRYRRFTKDEIEIATDSFSETKIIGEGSYGKVYRCDLNNTPVAVKVLHSDALEKKKEFLTEIEVLSQLRHPHIVLLLGACPETSCLVYEYMENGSLEDFISPQSSRDPLPWFVRFRIAFEVACGLAFLHNSKPNTIIHRDLNPGNILLDRNYGSRIGDVGLAKLVPGVTNDKGTECRASIVDGNLHYMDPEYLGTGTVRPKSDLYAFGIIVLQLLAAQPPDGLWVKFKDAISNGLLTDILDKSISDWPLVETQEMAQMALKCSELRCRDRPDLETEVLLLLKKLVDMADATARLQRSSNLPHKHFICPILERVMEDPYIAADGFTYEYFAIKTWLETHDYSPVTRYRLRHMGVIQNHSLRSAIQDWRSCIRSSTGMMRG